MINEIVVITSGGIPLYEARFDKNLEIDSSMLGGFTSALLQFGLSLFPREDLEDIVFTDHHLCLHPYQVGGVDVVVMLVHEPREKHVVLKKIAMAIYFELKQKFVSAITAPAVEKSRFQGLDECLRRIFHNERRAERLDTW